MDKKGKASYYRSCVPFLISLDALKEVISAPVKKKGTPCLQNAQV